MRLLTITLMGMAALAASGCAVTTAGVKKGDERNFARSLNDVSAGRAIKARMSRTEGFDLGDVDIEVAEGIAVLTGNVPTAEDRVEAERVAWSAPNIEQVGNEILLKGEPGLVRKTKDTVLGTSIRTRLIADSSVKARNVNIEAYEGIVYLLGVARTPQELERIAEIASTTKGTREVISYIKLAEGAALQANYTRSVPEHQTPPTPRAVPQGLSSMPTGPGVSDMQAAEPYYLDPQTGERIILPPGTQTIPYQPQAQGNIPQVNRGYGPQPLPNVTPLGDQAPTEFPSDQALGAYRSGQAGEPVSIIESEPYYIDPVTGQKIPVSYLTSGK